VELAYARRLGVRVEPVSGQAYTWKQPFQDFVRRVYRLKASAPKGALRSFAKDTLNGCYGKWGEDQEKETLLIFATDAEALDFITRAPAGTVNKLDQVGDPLDHRFLTQLSTRWTWNTHYALAAHVTAYSRIKLHKRMMKAKGLAYVDTDATHARRDNAVKTGARLGDWKVELDGYRAKFWAPKIYELHKGTQHTYAAKGFTLKADKATKTNRGKSAAAKFRAVVSGQGLSLSRNILLKTQLRRKGAVAREKESKRWGGRSRKRRALKDGSTVPWTVAELQGRRHEDAKSPLANR
jgi:hypothetical protein